VTVDTMRILLNMPRNLLLDMPAFEPMEFQKSMYVEFQAGIIESWQFIEIEGDSIE